MKRISSLLAVVVVAAVSCDFHHCHRHPREPHADLDRIAKGAAMYYRRIGAFPEIGTHPSDDDLCPKRSSPADRDREAWSQIGFAPSRTSPYHYMLVASNSEDGAAFTARAIGDLDCDGIYSTFELVGHGRSDGSVTLGTGIWKSNPSE